MAVPRSLPLLLSAALLGCGSTSSSTRPVAEEAVDEKGAALAARSHVQEIYGSLRRGDVGGVQSFAATDVFVLGPGGGHVYTDRSGAVVALGEVLRTGDRHKLSSRGLKASAAAGGHSAWAIDSLEVDGTAVSVSSVLVESDGLWGVVAVHVGRAADGDTKGAARADLPGGVDAGAGDAVKLFRAGLADVARFADGLGAGPDTAFVGPGAREVVRGNKAVAKLWKRRAAGGLRMALVGDVRAGATPDGSLVWIVANVDLTASPPEPAAEEPKAKGKRGKRKREREREEPIETGERRVLAIYERGEAGWQLKAMHESIAAEK